MLIDLKVHCYHVNLFRDSQLHVGCVDGDLLCPRHRETLIMLIKVKLRQVTVWVKPKILVWLRLSMAGIINCRSVVHVIVHVIALGSSSCTNSLG